MAYKTDCCCVSVRFKGVCFRQFILCAPGWRLSITMEILFLGLKLIAAGLATISLAGAGAGIGFVFAGFLGALARNPREENKLFPYALLGFALTEAIALFGLMIVFLILFGF